MTKILIKNIKIITENEENNDDKRKDILIIDGIINNISDDIICEDALNIRGDNYFVSPGLCDIHTHLRDPGFCYKEDIFSGTESAAKGGFCSICAMPNTKPCCDNEEVIRYIKEKSVGAKCGVYIISAITKKMEGKKLCDFNRFKNLGIVAVSDDGKCVANEELMEKAISEADKNKLTIISHCEDLKIVDGGIVNKGFISEYLGVKGIDRLSEDSITEREINLAEKTNGKIHIAHVSTEKSVDLIRQAKKRGVKITCETCPHYFIFTENEPELKNRNANFRMNPPLRTNKDKEAIINGIIDGTIDAIVTDHAPHSEKDKIDFENAPNGIIGLETSFSACFTYLVKPGLITLNKLIKLMHENPLKIIGMIPNKIEKGQKADLVIYDISEKWVVEKHEIVSKSRNSPFINNQLDSKIKFTICEGRITYEDIIISH